VSSLITIQKRSDALRQFGYIESRDLYNLREQVYQLLPQYEKSFDDLFELAGRNSFDSNAPNFDDGELHVTLAANYPQPGDCVFREQTPMWRLKNPMRDFGHVGIYLGMENSVADPSDLDNHKIIHVINDSPACQQTSLNDFIHYKGNKLNFWGFYSVSLSTHERSSIISKAKSYLNKCVYSFFQDYKNPPNFRCDGFVEHCYEAVGASIPPLTYRGGLFEDDLWKTMNPSALRNCFTRKIVVPGLP